MHARLGDAHDVQDAVDLTIAGEVEAVSLGAAVASPEDVATGAVPHQRANGASVRNRVESPTSVSRVIAGCGSAPVDLGQRAGIGRGQRRAEGVAAFMGTLAAKLVLLAPRDPESKGIVERRNGWFETSFMPGRSFASPADFNTQFGDWLRGANARIVRTTGVAPIARLDTDRSAMLPLPPVALHLGWRNRVRLGRDYYVRIDTCDYSVDPSVIGRFVDVAADLERVKVRAVGGSWLSMHGFGRVGQRSPTPLTSRRRPDYAGISISHESSPPQAVRTWPKSWRGT